jgi:gluconokinase
MQYLVVMGVAGSGKSTIAQSLARRLALPTIEGDQFHSAGNREKMRIGKALTDIDRFSWLQTLGEQWAQYPNGAVMACSALRRVYREQLRRDCSGLRFVYLQLSITEAIARVTQREHHFFNPSLVQSQFETLEAPSNELGVVTLDAVQEIELIAAQAIQWLQQVDAINARQPS